MPVTALSFFTLNREMTYFHYKLKAISTAVHDNVIYTTKGLTLRSKILRESIHALLPNTVASFPTRLPLAWSCRKLRFVQIIIPFLNRVNMTFTRLGSRKNPIFFDLTREMIMKSSSLPIKFC